LEVLLQENESDHQAANKLSAQKIQPGWEDFPLKEMAKRGWVQATTSELRSKGKEIVESFLAPLHGAVPSALWKRTRNDEKKADQASLFAWTARVLMRAQTIEMREPYRPGIISKEFLQELVKCSWSDQGPLLAKEYLARHGIVMVIEPHLAKTRLDGASMLMRDGRPIIGLTLRFDRVDHFWFVLLHELIHIQKHLRTYGEVFLDDLETDGGTDPKEREADTQSKEALIPRSKWVRSEAFRQRTSAAIHQFAKELNIHPAIVAGRIRHESGNYTQLNELVGNGQVRKLFPEFLISG
jgi:HTH-type transcriptional regulator/antitoxin HigA